MVAPPVVPFVDHGPNPYEARAIACDAGHPYHSAARRDTRIHDPHHEDPTNYESREDWQRALWKSKLPADAKRYIKQLENTAVDGWEQAFDAVWAKIEEALDRGLPITGDVMYEHLAEGARKQVQHMDADAFMSAFNGLYVAGREKADLSNGNGKKRNAQVIDTLEEQAMLSRLRDTALQKVKTITRQDLKEEILEALSRPGAAAKNPTAIANEIIKKERARLEEAIPDRKALRAELKKLYEQQVWKIQRITRTESANAYTLSQLKGYQAQGITKVRWHSHSYEQRTCAICLALDNTEHDIVDLLDDGGRYPLSTKSHPQCRCWTSPLIQHVTLEDMEKMYEDEPELFAPGQTVFDRAQLEMEDVVKEYQKTYGVELRDVPVESEAEVKETLGVIRETPYQQFQPVELRFVRDVGATDEFKAAVPEPVVGQVTAWTSPDNKLLISNFSVDGGNTVSATLIREWATKIYDQDEMVRRRLEEFYDRDAADIRPADLSQSTIRRLVDTVDPFTMMRRQTMDDGTPSVALEKQLRDAPEAKLRKILEDLEIRSSDIETIIKWRADRPIWGTDGVYIPTEDKTGSEHNRYVNRVAEVSARDMFVESTVAFVGDPHTLFDRDPDLFVYLMDTIFGGREFRN